MFVIRKYEFEGFFDSSINLVERLVIVSEFIVLIKFMYFFVFVILVIWEGYIVF